MRMFGGNMRKDPNNITCLIGGVIIIINENVARSLYSLKTGC